MTSRFAPLFAGLALLTVLAGGYGAAWLLAADTARDAVRDWAEERRETGYGVMWSALETSGFPGAVTVTLRDPQVRFPEDEGGGGWAAPVVTISARPWNPSLLTVDGTGEHFVNFVADGRVFTTRTTAARAVVQVDLADDGGLSYGRVDLKDVRTEGLALDAAVVELGSLTAAFEHNPGGRASLFERTEAHDTGIFGALSIDLRGLHLPPEAALPTGRMLQEVTLKAVVTEDLPPGPNLKARLRAWQENGGTMEVDRLTLAAGPMRIGAVGTLTLDDWLQPQAALTAQIRGFFEALEQLEDQGVIRPRDASVAKVVLGVMARQPPDGGPAALDLPITIQDRMFYLGPVALAELPPLRWGFQAPPGPGEIKPGFEIDEDGRVVREE
ncbi:hypothetical protein C882_0566 [Caenispirillum salinarum AK4]|uniref:DUF2125 domain-containing protein n=1 Tax=Caenispirillum salinarum AK4 TaxID=1238182 RepID=K9GWY2_9PROT|nr:DUF2125 domain-containing protein [Caenispirillum salinarum]EKV29259.1 hypothetical protein C882_0566 [Caenispirillum salinarum AK4]